MVTRISARDAARLLNGARIAYTTADEMGLVSALARRARERTKPYTDGAARATRANDFRAGRSEASPGAGVSPDDVLKTFSTDFTKVWDAILGQGVRRGEEKSTKAPHNFIIVDDKTVLVEMSVAGYAVKDVDVTEIEANDSGPGFLVIEGKARKDDRNFAQRGLAAHDFKEVFELPKGYKVISADFADGVLSITCRSEKEEKPVGRKIDIGTGK